MIRRNLTVIMVLAVMFSTVTYAQSPRFTWSSPRSMSLGGVSSTGFNDPSSMHLNPASLVDIERLTISAGTGLGFLSASLDGGNGNDSLDNENELSITPNVTSAFNLGSRVAGAAFSLNTFDYFHMRYPEKAFNKYQGNEMLLYSGGFDAALAFMPIRDWAVGFKVGYIAAHAEWTRQMNPFESNPPPDQFDCNWSMELDATADWSALGGVIWTPSYRFEMGMTYRPSMAYHFDPEISVSLPEIMGGQVISSGAKELRFEIPQEIKLGFHWLASERVDLYMDLGWTNYSAMDDFEITTYDPKADIIAEKYRIPVEMKDSWHGHLGLEYLASGFLTFRAGGYFYTDNAEEGYQWSLIPQGEEIGVTAGLGINLFEWDIDIAGGYSRFASNEITGSELPYSVSGDIEFTQIFGSISARYRF